MFCVSLAARASLVAYDAAIAEDASAGLTPLASLTSAVVLTGANRVAFDFGPVSGDATIEFILAGDPGGSGSYLAVGANRVSNLRYSQWPGTGQLGFTQLGVEDYLFNPPVASPTELAHVAYVWNAASRTMKLYRGGTLAGTVSGVSAGFAMPAGQGWLGANPGGTEAMVGTIHRVTVYRGMVAEEVVARHADAFAGVTRPPVIVSFSATPDTLFAPALATLRWEVRNATAVFIDGRDVTGQSTLAVAPVLTTTFTLTATNAAASSQSQVTVRVDPAPVINRFAASRSHFAPGETVTMSWEVEHGRAFTIAPGVGDVTVLTVGGVGSVKILPAASSRYTLTAGNAFGEDTATADLRLVQPASHLVISEFLADDESVLADEEGEHSGWIEIHNPTAATVNLAGHYLTDAAASPMRWAFPPMPLAGGAHLVVFASGKNRTNVAAALHTNFRLNNDGEFLALVGSGPKWLHAFDPAFPPQRPDISYGILGGDPGLARYLGVPTPGAPNDERPPPPAPVEFSVPGRLFTEGFTVSLSSPEPEAEIRFTVDGSAPGPTNGTRDAGEIRISQTTHLRAVALAAGLASPLSGATYLKLGADLANYTSPLPIMVIENFGAGTIRQKGWNSTGADIKQVPRQTAAWATFERVDGVSSLTNAPQMLSLVGIRGRGAYSSAWRQKPYSVEAVDEAGAEIEVSPLGLPAHADWVLYYPDPEPSRDPTLLFNTFAYELSRDCGNYAVRFRWVEAFINENGGDLGLADRRGVYAIIERVARGADRLDFQRLSADGSTGGWLLNINRMDPEPETGWPTANGAVEPWFFHTAGPNRILQTQPNRAYGSVPGDDQPQQPNAYINFDNPNGYTITPGQRAAVEGWFKQFEGVLYNNAVWRHPTDGYRRYLDTADFIDYFILNTLTRNGDGLLISMFPWKGDDGRLRIGPAWDYNWSSYYVSGGPTGSLLHRSERLWYPRLFADPDFQQAYIDRWWDLRRGPLGNAAMEAIIDGQAADITPAKALLNAMPGAGEWANRLGQMKSWLRQRADWIDSNYLRPPAFNQNGGEVPDGFAVVVTSTAGTVYVTTDGTDPRAPGGAVATGARSYTGPFALHSPTLVQARVRNGANWSGLTAAHFFTPQDLTPLVVTEIMYHPPDWGAWSGDDLEFVELQNLGPNRLHLGGLGFTSGVAFTFNPGTQLGPGQFVVLARNPAAFQSRYPPVAVGGVYTGRLDNAGETLRLATPAGSPVFEITYDDRAPWPLAADGGGASLQRWVLAGSGDDPANWVAASPTPGTGVIVGEPPTITVHPLSQAVVAGSEVTLSVAVASTATPPFHYRWQCDGRDVAGGSFVQDQPVCFLTITNAQPACTSYRVLISNPASPAGIASAVVVLSFLADVDHDGQADSWETAVGLSSADPTDRDLDYDGDGMRNWEEHVAGTDPTNAVSRLKLMALPDDSGAGTSLRFRAISNRTYTVEYTDRLGSGTWLPLADIVGRAADRDETVRDAGPAGDRFYRLRTPRKP